MPRFDDACVPLLKTVMLQRVPECCFLPEDVALITSQTGLSAAQVERWGMNIRFRYTTFEEREAYLRKDKDDAKVRPGMGKLFHKLSSQNWNLAIFRNFWVSQ